MSPTMTYRLVAAGMVFALAAVTMHGAAKNGLCSLAVLLVVLNIVLERRKSRPDEGEGRPSMPTPPGCQEGDVESG